MSNPLESILIILLEHRALSVVSLHCGNGGLAFDQSLTDIFQVFHHKFLWVANKTQPY